MKKERNDYIIYKVQNELNGKIYIGATTDSIHKRKLDHIERSNRGEVNKFHEAISTYGADAFSWEQIDTVETRDDLAHKEKQFILEYNAKENGYNSDCGGGFKKTIYQYSIDDGSLVRTFETLKNAGNAINATKQRISSTCLSVNKTYGGFYWSYEYKEPFQPFKDSRTKNVYQYSLEGYLLARFDSVSEASRQTGISKSCISKVCRMEREQTGGYKWEYV